MNVEFVVGIKEGAKPEDVKKNLGGIADGAELIIEGKVPKIKGTGSYQTYKQIVRAAESVPDVSFVEFVKYIRDED
ncbi:hypothetical protein HYX16_03555 [Candidatus Woesearchaeota archaeon]|nr:hypothetical protein [Candidatus Woesearchaeota archaeon]